MFTRPIRGWVIFAQVLGTILSVIGLIALAAVWDDAMNSLQNTNNDLSYATAKTVMSLIMALLCYIIIKQVINMAVIIHACQTMDDITLSANRWIISALSLTVGGFFTPMIMTMFPNVNIKSTIKPKVFLSKVYGWTFLAGAAVFMIVFGSVANSSLTTTNAAKGITIAFFVINGLMFLLGIALVALFTRKNASEIYDNNSALSTTMKVFANIIAGVVTLELFVMLIYNWVEIIGSIMSMFDSSDNSNGSINPFMIILAIFNLFLSLIYIGYLTQMTCQTMVGIWKNQADYTGYAPLQNRQNNTSNVTL